MHEQRDQNDDRYRDVSGSWRLRCCHPIIDPGARLSLIHAWVSQIVARMGIERWCSASVQSQHLGQKRVGANTF